MVTLGMGRGGYCMELNGLLLAVLESLGFDVRACGAKVNDSVFMERHDTPRKDLKYSGWNHMVLLVDLPGGDRVLTDVGFGGGNPTGPLRLAEGETRINVVGSKDGTGKDHVLRLSKDDVEGNEMWVLDRLVHRPELPEEGEFRPFYAFTEMKFSPADFEIMNHHVATARGSFFTYQIIVVMSVLSEDGEKVVGDMVVLGDRAKKRVYGQVVKEKKFEGEQDRIQTLQEWFGIKLSDVEQSGIKGLPSMLH